MTLYSIVIIFGISCHTLLSSGFPIAGINDAVLYLEKFGYLEELTSKTRSTIRDQEKVSIAIEDFQRFAGLNETGELDEQTISKMNAPRCGEKDKIIRYESDRMKPYSLEGSKWHEKELTYHISKYPTQNIDKEAVRAEIARAFQIWSNVTMLNFKEVLTAPANIDIRFEARNHGDEDPFDGPNGILAHAAPPQYGGEVHFDDDEIWIIYEECGTNFLEVAAHEIGHSLGLKHSEVKGALMYPFYHEYVSEFELHPDDIEAIQAIYGIRDKHLPPDDENAVDIGPLPDKDHVLVPCKNATIDTITRTKSGKTYAFRGDFYWKVHPDGVSEKYPRKISEDWDGLEGNLDASLTWSNGKTFFFKDSRYWRFTNKKMDNHYPKLISVGFKGIPDNLDAAFVWGANGRTYFFKGDSYWRFDLDTDPSVKGYPAPISAWSKIIQSDINAAFRWDNNFTYFFKGEKYYRYNDITEEIESNPSYPRSTAIEWFGCRSIDQKSTETAYSSFLDY